MEFMPEFRLHRPTATADAVRLRAENPDARYLAGGTDLIVNMRHGLVELETLVDLGAVVAMKRLEADAAGLHIGAGVTLRDLAENDAVSESYTAIRQAALAVAGGNLSHLVKTNTFMTHREDIPAYREMRAKYLPNDDPPVSTLILCSGLADPDFRIEIEAIAVVP